MNSMRRSPYSSVSYSSSNRDLLGNRIHSDISRRSASADMDKNVASRRSGNQDREVSTTTSTRSDIYGNSRSYGSSTRTSRDNTRSTTDRDRRTTTTRDSRSTSTRSNTVRSGSSSSRSGSFGSGGSSSGRSGGGSSSGSRGRR